MWQSLRLISFLTFALVVTGCGKEAQPIPPPPPAPVTQQPQNVNPQANPYGGGQGYYGNNGGQGYYGGGQGYYGGGQGYYGGGQNYYGYGRGGQVDVRGPRGNGVFVQW